MGTNAWNNLSNKLKSATSVNYFKHYINPLNASVARMQKPVT